MGCCCNNGGNSISEDFVVYGTQFTSQTEYANSFLKGRFRVYMRGLGFLTRGVEWDFIETGGFKIIIAGFVVTPETIITGQFY